MGARNGGEPDCVKLNPGNKWNVERAPWNDDFNRDWLTSLHFISDSPYHQNMTNCFPNSIYDFKSRRRGNGWSKQHQVQRSTLASIPVKSIHSSCHFPTKLILRGRILATKSEPKQKFSLSCLRYLLFNPPPCRNRPKIDTLDLF